MADYDQEDTRDYVLVVNDEEQYSVWLADREVPRGWRTVTVGEKSSKAECLKRIGEVWTDVRPKTLRAAAAEDRA